MTIVSPDQLDQLAIDTIRTLAIDGVQQANFGHPGAPMGIALDHFGASAPASAILWAFGFTAAAVADVGRRVVRQGQRGRVVPRPVAGEGTIR